MYVVNYNLHMPYTLVSIQKKKEETKKNSLMAKMMLDASFLPVFVTAALPIMYVIDYNVYML